jgi:energy-coupling factor transport system substrate-specific component
MRCAFTMWKSTRMIVLTAIIAAIYATVYVALSPFSIRLIPNVLEVSWRSILPMMFGVLFGPAASWGCGIGNLVGDFVVGSFGPGVIFGFLLNFGVAYVGYALWSQFRGDSRVTISSDGFWQIAKYLTIGVIAASVGAVVLAWGLNLLGIAPFQLVAIGIFGTLVMGNWLGAILFFLLVDRIRSLGLTWTSIMRPNEIGEPISGNFGTILLIVGGLGGWVVGTFLVHDTSLTSMVGAFFLMIIVGALLTGPSRTLEERKRESVLTRGMR